MSSAGVPDPGRDLAAVSTFARYVLAIGVALWFLSVLLAPDDLTIILTERPTVTTELPSAPGAFLPRFAPTPTTTAGPAPGSDAVDRIVGERRGADLAVGGSGDADRAVDEPGDSLTRSDADRLDVTFALVGPSGASETTGVAEIVFDPVQNQICHRFEIDGTADPSGRIGIGRSAEQAGVVVDLGRLEPGQTACTRVSSTAMEALVASEADHFVEVDDASGGQVARGQSSPSDGAAQVEAPAIPDGVDPTVVSAGLSARPGVLTLAGAAPSQATADLLRGELAVLDGTGIEVIDQVTIDPAAAPPAGGIVVDQTDLFAVDSHDLSSEGETIVRQLAILFQRNPEWTITVSGHTDSTGDEVNNLELGLRRATEVLDILIAEGVSADRMTAEGVGAPKPIADNKTLEGRAKNRRFEIEIRRD